MLPDERILAGFEIMAAPTAELLRYLYPNLYPISDPAGDWGRPTAGGRYASTIPMPLNVVIIYSIVVSLSFAIIHTQQHLTISILWY